MHLPPVSSFEALNDFRSQANLPRFNMPQKLVEAGEMPSQQSLLTALTDVFRQVAQLGAVAQLLSLRRTKKRP